MNEGRAWCSEYQRSKADPTPLFFFSVAITPRVSGALSLRVRLDADVRQISFQYPQSLGVTTILAIKALLPAV